MATRSPFAGRAGITLLHDVAMAAISFPLSLYLRLGEHFWLLVERFFWLGFTLFTGLAAIVFALVGPYRNVWRYASMMDLTAILRAVSLTILLFLPLLFLATRLYGFPRSALVINWFVLLFLLGAPRFAYRLLKDRSLANLFERERAGLSSVLLVGAGDAAELFIREMRRDPASAYRIVGILDENGGRIGGLIQGIEVVGGLADAEMAIERLRRDGLAPQRLILTEDLPRERIEALLAIAEANGLSLARLPRLTDFHGDDTPSPIALRPIAIEDLLGRPQRVLDRAPVERLVAGRRVLVTGAGGSIGSELCRQIAGLGPVRLVLLDHSESLLYAIHAELAAAHPNLPIEPQLCDIRDRPALDRAVETAKPELVFHAAALKHVPLCEAHPDEAVRTNILGTRNLAAICRARGVAAMVLISTDKAVEPASMLGATKRLAERYCQALDASVGAGTRFAIVRFGNVLGSSGSVVPLFQTQLAQGGPLTVTDPAVERFFMTVAEAVELVLHASAFAVGGGRRGAILVLEMGQAVRIVDLARQMIRLAGKVPGRDVEIRFTGLRPGEKLTERLFGATEEPQPTGLPDILQTAAAPAELAALERELDTLDALAQAGDENAIRQALRRLLPDYAAAGAAPAATTPSAAARFQA